MLDCQQRVEDNLHGQRVARVSLDDGIQLRVQVARVMCDRLRDVCAKTEQAAKFLHIRGNKDELAAFDPQHVGMMHTTTLGNLNQSQPKRIPPLP